MLDRTPETQPSDVAAYDAAASIDPALSGAIDHARAQLEAVERDGNPTVVAAWRRALDRLERRLPQNVARP